MVTQARGNILGLSGAGFVLGAVFFSASLTPSLIPRDHIVQGVLGGIACSFGYGIGLSLMWLWRYMELPEPGGRSRKLISLVTGVACLALVLLSLGHAAQWQNSIRAVMNMEPVDSAYPASVALLSAVVFLALFALMWGIIYLGKLVSSRIRRFMPRKAANVLGALVTIIIVWTIANGVLIRYAFNILDVSFREYDALIEPDRPQPLEPDRTGSVASLLHWKELGRAGREFVASGPAATEISALTGRTSMTPIRVYAGLQVADTPEKRARLALDELIRQHAFDRSILVIITPTGTGWIDPSAMDGLEFLHDGNVASVAMQYSYLNSPLSLLFQSENGATSSRALFLAIYDYWKKLPADQRPKLYLHGLSLGAFNSQRSVSFFDILNDPIDGAVWSGTPFPSSQWRSITNAREKGTPQWLPVFQDGTFVRFMNQNGFAPGNGTRWGRMRMVYLQYASDAITFFDQSALYQEPDWMKAPRGPDVSPSLRWYPVITFLQLAVDMALADTTPMGHGHVFAPEHYVEAWKEVTAVENWSAGDIDKLKRYLRTKANSTSDSELRGG